MRYGSADPLWTPFFRLWYYFVQIKQNLSFRGCEIRTVIRYIAVDLFHVNIINLIISKNRFNIWQNVLNFNFIKFSHFKNYYAKFSIHMNQIEKI